MPLVPGSEKKENESIKETKNGMNIHEVGKLTTYTSSENVPHSERSAWRALMFSFATVFANKEVLFVVHNILGLN